MFSRIFHTQHGDYRGIITVTKVELIESLYNADLQVRGVKLLLEPAMTMVFFVICTVKISSDVPQ